MQIPTIEQYAMRAFASALDAVPLALAENSGLSPIETLAAVKSRQVTEGNSRLGIDCVGSGNSGARGWGLRLRVELMRAADMKEQFVYDPLISKRQQYLLATQVKWCGGW
jgi:T-complex protein 1 subunit epsilon